MPVGRPRAFDVDEALDRALNVFWRKGYEGATLPDLTKAMRINRPSLYAAFGNKESLFRQALQRYLQGPAGHVAQAMQKPTAREVVVDLWHGSIALVTNPRNPRGCFLVQCALACGDEAAPVQKELTRHRAALETLLRKRFEQARAEGDLPSDTKPADLARFVTAIAHGMAVQAAGGATAADLKRVVKTALRAWPR